VLAIAKHPPARGETQHRRFGTFTATVHGNNNGTALVSFTNSWNGLLYVRCGTEGDFYRRGTCALREDLTASMIDSAHNPTAMTSIVDALCRVDRPASILTWKLSPKVQALLAGLASGDIPLTHQGLDDAGIPGLPICAVCSRTPASFLPATNPWPGSNDGSHTSSTRSPSQPCAVRSNNSPSSETD
jgi:hypothetical protein